MTFKGGPVQNKDGTTTTYHGATAPKRTPDPGRVAAGLKAAETRRRKAEARQSGVVQRTFERLERQSRPRYSVKGECAEWLLSSCSPLTLANVANPCKVTLRGRHFRPTRYALRFNRERTVRFA